MSFNGFLNHDGLSYLWSKVVNRISSSETNITAKIPIASDDLPKDLGPSSSGVSSKFSRSDHVHKVPDDIVSYTDAQTGVEETTKINADLLENHPASDFALKTHASQHKVGGSDPILPADISAVGYDAEQTITDEQKAKARGNIGAAPGGYGSGDYGKMLTTDDDLNTITVGGHYLFFGNSIPKNAPTGLNEWTAYVVENLPYNELVTAQILHIIVPDLTSGYGKYSNCSLRRTRYGSAYTPWEWINPPMLNNIDYATIERYMGKSVHRGFFDDFEVWGYDNGPGWMSAGKSIRYILDAGGTKNISLHEAESYIFSSSDNARAGVAIVQCTNNGINAVTPLVPLRNWKIEAGSGLSVNITETSGKYNLGFYAMML